MSAGLKSEAGVRFETGTPVEFISVATITLEQLKTFADAAGDPNPIHQDEAVAKAAGLPGIIAHGMLIASLVAQRGLLYIADRHGQRGMGAASAASVWTLRSCQTRFRGMTLLGDQVFVGGSVKSCTDSELCLELQAKNQKDEVTTTALMKFVR
ncbi:MAG: MaoC family dehydratase [Methylotenera sp.]|nr:MaoC family dehydratase [Oligoflexia bacterium]